MLLESLILFFNKQIVADLQLDNIYTLVKENKWTYDKFFELANAATADLNGDGQMTDDDRYGIVTRDDMIYPAFWVSAGIKTVGKDENDLLMFIGNNEKLYGILENVHQKLFGGQKIQFSAGTDKATTYAGLEWYMVPFEQFKNNQALFFAYALEGVASLRDMETDFGILPFPKYDEAQDKYYARVLDGWINIVPIHAPDLERTSVIMESLAVESRNYTIPAYFDIALTRKYSRDDDSWDMLEIIHGSRTFDMGDVFYLDAVRQTYVNVLCAGKNDFASAVEKRTASMEKALNKANEAALALD